MTRDTSPGTFPIVTVLMSCNPSSDLGLNTNSLLAGLVHFRERIKGTASIVRAAVASFGFVYVLTMADGNGRISRFLINNI